MTNVPSLKSTGQDLNAGLLVALVGIPQCLAYALLAGIPPMYGLSTAIVAGALAALLGKSHRVTVGPTNTTGLIVLASLAPFASAPELLLPAMAVLTVLAGAWRLVIVLARAERIFNFIPEAVMLGFATGAAFLIAWMQLDDLLGQPAQGIRTAFAQLLHLQNLSLSAIDLPGLSLGLVALVGVIAGRTWVPRLPTALIMLLLTTTIAVLLPPALKQQVVFLGGAATITNGWPAGAWPELDAELWTALITPALAIAMIGSLELIVTLRTNREMHHLTHELRAQGVANVVAAFASAFPASASLTRSALLKLGNAQSRLAPMLAALILLPILLFGGDWIQQIPLGVIAGLLIATAWSMLDMGGIHRLWVGNSQTRALFATTLASTLVVPFHYAILFGIGLSVVMFLYQTSHSELRWFVRDEKNRLRELGPPNSQKAQDAQEEQYTDLYLQVSGSLYFAAAKALPHQVISALPEQCRSLMIDLAHAHQPRYSAILALQEIADYCAAHDISISIGRADQSFIRFIHRCNLNLPLSHWDLDRSINFNGRDPAS